jgi:hypothetical protein
MKQTFLTKDLASEFFVVHSNWQDLILNNPDGIFRFFYLFLLNLQKACATKYILVVRRLEKVKDFTMIPDKVLDASSFLKFMAR